MTTADQIRYYGQHTDADPTRRSYSIGDQAAQSVVRMARESGTVAVDIETAGLDEKAFQVKVVIVATRARSCVLDGTDARHRAAAREALSAARELVFQNSAFDVPPLVTAGIMRLDDISKVVDTLIYSRMSRTGELDRHSLGAMETRYLAGQLRSASKDMLAEWGKVNRLTKGQVFERAHYEDPVYAMYAGWDGILTAMVLDPVRADARRQLTDHPFGRYGADAAQAEYLMEREQRVNRVMLRRSARGLALDHEHLATEQERLRVQMNGLAEVLAEFGIADPSNRNQLVRVLEADDAFPENYPVTKTGKYSTAKGILDAVDHPAVVAFRKHDQSRRLFTYMEHGRLTAEYTDGRIHPQVKVMGARTGRMSYGNPELHQFVAGARTIIRRDDEHRGLVSIDWSTIEPVTVANLAGDVAAMENFERSGEKFYNIIVEAAGVSYKTAKIVMLAALYGQQIKSLSASLSKELERKVPEAEAKDLQARVLAPLPMTRRFCGWSAAWSEEIGKTWTVSGRIIDVPTDAGYKGTNYTVQGSAYDILSETVCEIDEAGLADHLYLTMHDECVVSDEAAPEVRRIMQRPPERLCELASRRVVLRTDAAFLGDHWDDADNHPTWTGEDA